MSCNNCQCNKCRSKKAGASSKYSIEVMKEILSDVGEFTPLRKDFKLRKEGEGEFDAVGTGVTRYDLEGDDYREIIPDTSIQELGFSYGARWMKEDEIIVSVYFRNGDEEQFDLEKVSSLSPVKLAKKIAKMIMQISDKFESQFHPKWLEYESDPDAAQFYTDEPPKRRYAGYGETPPLEYFDAYNAWFRSLKRTLLAPADKEVFGSLAWDLYQAMVGYDMSGKWRLGEMEAVVSMFKKRLTKEVKKFNAEVETIKAYHRTDDMGKSAGAIDLSHNGELASILLDYFCDEFGFNGMEMSKFITKAYKQIKSDIKYANTANAFGEKMRVPFGGYYPTRKGLEECLRNMSRANFGILVMDTGRKPTLAGTDC